VKRQLTDCVSANTEQLNTIISLSEERKRIESALDLEQESVTTEFSGPAKKDVADRVRLMETVRRQAYRIEDLKIQLAQYMRKSTNIVFPSLSGNELDESPYMRDTTMDPIPLSKPPTTASIDRSALVTLAIPMSASSAPKPKAMN
jgi:hypothetical protein